MWLYRVVKPTDEIADSCEWHHSQFLCLLSNKKLTPCDQSRSDISTLLQNQQLIPYNQSYKQNPYLLGNLLLNMWKLRPLLLLQGTAALSNHQPVFRNLRLRLSILLQTLF